MPDILVAGGGIGGLATALALAHHGHRIDVFEQAPVFGEVGAGVQLGPNVTRRLKTLGLNVGLTAIAARPEALVVRSAGDDSELARLPLGNAMAQRYGAPYLCVHRADLHALLLDGVRQRSHVSLSASLRIEQVATTDQQVSVSGSDTDAATSSAATVTWQGDALIGADGLWSAVRQQVDAGAMPPRQTGHTAWRALIEQAALPFALRRNEIHVWLGPRLHALAYPVRGGAWLNVVVLAESAPAGDARDWDQAGSLVALQQATGGCNRALQMLLEAMPQWRAWSLSDRAPMTSANDMVRGRIALVGDAAHPMLPYLAQGAGMAIEDAVTLAEALGAGGPADVPDAFLRYAEARWQRNARVQARARRNGEIFHATGPVRWGRDMAMRLMGPRLLDQPWLYAG
jgi:salicylate hydroxylase